ALSQLVRGYHDLSLAWFYGAIKSHPLSEQSVDLLVEQQDRPTIERKLQELLDDGSIHLAERPCPQTTPIDWIRRIRSEFAWDKLRKLRLLALHHALPNIVGLVTETMKVIDLPR